MPLERKAPVVAPADGTGNANIADVIGNRTDMHSTSTLAGLVNLLTEHVHEAAKVIPTGTVGLTITCDTNSAWDLGAFGILAATNAITSDFDIHYINVENMTANATYEIVIYAGANASEVEIGRLRTVRTDKKDTAIGSPFMCPLQDANTQIKAKVMSSTGAADQVTLSMEYHTY